MNKNSSSYHTAIPPLSSSPPSSSYNSMDIKRLVNSGRAQMNGDCWTQHPHTLPPVSAILPDHAYPGHHYPIPPQGEGNVYTHYQQQVYQQQQPPPQSYFPPLQSYQQGPPPSYQSTPTTDLPYTFTNPAARASSSTVSSTRYAPSITSSSGPATSAERRSLSDGEDDGEDSDENLSGGSNTPLPPYYATNQQQQQQPQQVCFDGTVTPPSDRSGSEPESTNEFVCDVCNVSYSRAPDLRRHKASVHNDRDSREKVSATFPCEVCGQILLSSHGYQGHMRRHYDERPFVCEAPFCGKAFHDSATLARHRRTHSTEHKFECDFCGRRFKRKDNLNTHRKKHQVGGEAINPNLLRKPVSRVATTGGTAVPESPVETPTPASTAFAELPTPTTASYQQQQIQVQVAPPPPPMQLSQPQPPMMDVSSVPPAYTAAMQMDPRRQQQQQPLYAPQPQPMYHPYQQTTIALHHQQPPHHHSQQPYLYHPQSVKAEDSLAYGRGMPVYAVNPPRH